MIFSASQFWSSLEINSSFIMWVKFFPFNIYWEKASTVLIFMLIKCLWMTDRMTAVEEGVEGVSKFKKIH